MAIPMLRGVMSLLAALTCAAAVPLAALVAVVAGAAAVYLANTLATPMHACDHRRARSPLQLLPGCGGEACAPQMARLVWL